MTDASALVERIRAFAEESSAIVNRPEPATREEAERMLLKASALLRDIMDLPKSPETRRIMEMALAAFQENPIDKNKLI